MTKQPQCEKQPSPVQRTSAGLRDAIFDEIDGIRSGTSNPLRANSVAKLANAVIESVRMELEVQRYLAANKTPKEIPDTLLGGAIPLGVAPEIQ